MIYIIDNCNIIVVFSGGGVSSHVVEIKGGLLESNDEVSIFEGFPYCFYELNSRPLLSADQIAFDSFAPLLSGVDVDELKQLDKKRLLPADVLSSFSKSIAGPILQKMKLRFFLEDDETSELKEAIVNLMADSSIEAENPELVINKIIDVSFGYGALGPLVRDASLEEIMVNGYGLSVFVFHRKHGMCKTNLTLTQKELDFLVERISSTDKKKFGEAQPFLDSRLLGGERVNATFSNVTPLGTTLTIRKFTTTPLSVIDLIANKTLSSELAAFLWVMVEGLNVKPMNIIMTGGSGSGKTTTLNVLCSFVRHVDRIITIEDTIELNLGGRENWVRMEAKPKIYGPTEITMDSLLKNSLRMRPDRVVLGEVRGVEAQTLFVAMDIGHEGSMGTLHANNSNEAITRLTSSPMSVPEPMISLLDLIIVQSRMNVKGRGMMRRVTQVAEVSSLEKKPLVSTIFEWDRQLDQIKRTDVPSSVIEALAEKTLLTKKEIMKEIIVRKKILEYLLAKKITKNTDVETVIQKYYYSPESVLEMVVKGFGG